MEAFVCANNPDESDIVYLNVTYHFRKKLGPYPMNWKSNVLF